MEYLLICLLCCLVSVHANTGFGLPAASPVAHVNDVLDGLAAEIALFGAKLQRIALKVDANMPISRFDHTFSRHHVHDRRSRVHTRGMAHPAAVLEQAPGSLGLVLPDTTSVAFTEVRLRVTPYSIQTATNAPGSAAAAAAETSPARSADSISRMLQAAACPSRYSVHSPSLASNLGLRVWYVCTALDTPGCVTCSLAAPLSHGNRTGQRPQAQLHHTSCCGTCCLELCSSQD